MVCYIYVRYKIITLFVVAIIESLVKQSAGVKQDFPAVYLFI